MVWFDSSDNALLYNGHSYLLAILIAIVTIVSYQLLADFLLKKVKSFFIKDQEEKGCFEDILAKPFRYFILLLGLHLSWSLAPFSSILIQKGTTLFTTLFAVVIFWVFVRITENIQPGVKKIGQKIGLNLTDNFLKIVIRSLKSLIIVVAFLSILQACGINVAAFLGVLGLMGVAVALATQEIIKSFLGTFVLLVDETYKEGDHIRIGQDLEGTVEAIEMRSTIVLLKDGGIARISNGALLKEPIWNYTQKSYKH